MRSALSVICAATLVGCATTGVMDGIMASWKGAPVDEVVARWGYPTAAATIAGRQLLYWDRTAQYVLPGVTTGTAYRIGQTIHYSSTSTPPAVIEGGCRRILEVRDGLIAGWEWQGNDCPVMTVGAPYSSWRR